MITYQYIGSELELFANASNWKAYLRTQLAGYLGKEVLEVGAGLGATTQVLCPQEAQRWVCLEPDAALAEQLAALRHNGVLPAACQVVVGTLGQHTMTLQPFDTVLYIDVLEHIENDRSELQKALDHLQCGGYMIVLAPAHAWLFTPFDTAIGHFRRYTKASLAALTPEAAEIVQLRYLDAIGLLASLGNRLVLKRSMPSARQIASWDKLMVPLSRLADPLLHYSVGKSVLAIWRKKSPGK
jgi:protein-L-isoaspartate O-methyltransferase